MGHDGLSEVLVRQDKVRMLGAGLVIKIENRLELLTITNIKLIRYWK